MASNATVHADLDFGKYSDWIELYNNSDQDIDLSGYYLSDDPFNPTMWPFQSGTILPAYEFLLVYADGLGAGLHTNFKLAKEGELLMLADSFSEILDSLRYPAQLSDISYGLDPSDFQASGYFEVPTPGGQNSMDILKGLTPGPVFFLEGGFYTGAQSIAISNSQSGATIYYTLDGTEPDKNAVIYTSPIPIVQNTVLRAIAINDSLLTGPVITRTYFIDEPQNLPVISLVCDPDHFFSDETGIYVEGTGGVPGYCTTVPHNVNQDWERPVNIELFEMDGSIGLNQLTGVKIFGGCSRVRYPIKSLAFYARKEYDASSFKYQLFPDKPNTEYETFILRASADDQPFTLLRDPLTHMLVKDVIDVDMQGYRPMVLYINGEYWGIHNMREKINENYAADNFGVNSDSVDLILKNTDNPSNIVAGNAIHYDAMMAYLQNNDISQEVHYEYIKTQMDMDEYISYQTIQIFFGGRDWPGNNIKFWRSHEAPNNKWRWILYDLDHMFKEYFSDIMDEASELDCDCTWPNPPWSTYLFRRLLENEAFQKEFVQKFSIYSTSHFSRERIHRYIDEMQAVIAPEIPRHIERWGGQKTNLPDNTWVAPIFNSVEEWEAMVQEMHHFTDVRHELALKHVSDHFGYSGYANLEALIEAPGGGLLSIGATPLQDDVFSGDFPVGETLSVTWKKQEGYLLSHWLLEQYQPYDSSLIASGDQWKYLVTGTGPDPDWMQLDYNDLVWAAGPSQLGYGDDDEQTLVEYGGDPANKYVTTWFRKTFIIEDTAQFHRYTLNLLRDDGARVFVNGLAVIRDNLQRWWVGNSSLAETVIQGSEESEWISYTINPALFRQGDNIIAVEVHQADASSSDMSFDLELVARMNSEGKRDTIFENKIELELLFDSKLTAFVISDTIHIEDIFINEVMASNNAIYPDEKGEFEDWIELYNAGEETVDLGGLLLSDTLPALQPWIFPLDRPELTSIQPREFIVVYADNDTEQGPLHADFKLGKTGEEVALLQKIGLDTLLIDRLVFVSQTRNISFGRYPDGGPVFEYMTEATPSGPNKFSLLGVKEVVGKTASHQDISVYPIPTDGLLYIGFPDELADSNLKVDIKIYSITGRLISSSQHQGSGLLTLSLDNQPEGLYLLRVSAGKQLFVKRIVIVNPF